MHVDVPCKDLCSYLLGKGLVRRVWMRLHILDADPGALAPFCVLGFPDSDQSPGIELNSHEQLHYHPRRVTE